MAGPFLRDLEGFTQCPSTHPLPVLQLRPRKIRDAPTDYKAGARMRHAVRHERFRTSMDASHGENREWPFAESILAL